MSEDAGRWCTGYCANILQHLIFLGQTPENHCPLTYNTWSGNINWDRAGWHAAPMGHHQINELCNDIIYNMYTVYFYSLAIFNIKMLYIHTRIHTNSKDFAGLWVLVPLIHCFYHLKGIISSRFLRSLILRHTRADFHYNTVYSMHLIYVYIEHIWFTVCLADVYVI